MHVFKKNHWKTEVIFRTSIERRVKLCYHKYAETPPDPPLGRVLSRQKYHYLEFASTLGTPRGLPGGAKPCFINIL